MARNGAEQAIDEAVDRPRLRALYVASVAGGGGDVAFAGGVLRALLGPGAPPVALALCVVKQAGGSAAAALLELARDVPAPLLARLRSVRLLERAGAGARAAAAEPQLLEQLPPLLRSLLLDRAARADADVVLQGPLRVFGSGAEALAAASDSGPLASEQLPPPPPPPPPLPRQPRLVTIREFGQARFAALSEPAHAGDIDASAGLAHGELGVFDVRSQLVEDVIAHDEAFGAGAALPQPRTPLALDEELLALLPAGAARDAVGAAAAPRPFVVGYFRTARYAAAFGRAVASALALDASAGTGGDAAGSAADAADGGDLVVFMPVGDATAAAHFLSGLRSHPHVAAVESEEGETALRVSLLVGSGAAGDSVGLHSRRRLALIDSMGMGLPRRCFRRLLARARLAVVTGDATLSEALAFGAPFLYCAEGHKGGVRDALRELAGRGGGGGAVAAFWAFCEDGGSPWSSLESALAGGGWPALASAFSVWSGSVCASRGGLATRVRALVHGDDLGL